MSRPVSRPLVEAFHRQVVEFHTPRFSLAEDLGWLDRQRAIQAPVGVVLHASRILEVLARDAVARADLEPPNDHFREALLELTRCGQLAGELHTLLDGLRELGNRARHALGYISFPAAEQGYALMVRGMQWYFCEFAGGLGLKSLTAHGEPLDVLLPAGLASLLAWLEAEQIDERGLLDALGLARRDCQLLLSPVFPAVLAQRLLDDKRMGAAEAVLTVARQRFPEDVRLRQLEGLLWSRTRRLVEACACLEAIEPVDAATDEETLGILAGAYKRRADAEPERRDEWLRASHAKYEWGWRRSQGTNTYLGINTAALALWLGVPGQTAPLAGRVRDLLEGRRLRLERAVGPSPRFLGMWDQLTLAEAHLLRREWDAAKQRYREARERFTAQTKALEVAREQAKGDLTALGHPELLGNIFPA